MTASGLLRLDDAQWAAIGEFAGTVARRKRQAEDRRRQAERWVERTWLEAEVIALSALARSDLLEQPRRRRLATAV